MLTVQLGSTTTSTAQKDIYMSPVDLTLPLLAAVDTGWALSAAGARLRWGVAEGALLPLRRLAIGSSTTSSSSGQEIFKAKVRIGSNINASLPKKSERACIA